MALILASKSPRRRELLAQMGLTDFEIHPALGEELAQPDLTPPELVQALALHKAQEVAQAFAQSDDVVIGADTIVVLDGQVLGKPHDEAHALAMLTALSGREHHVYTGVAVLQDGRALVQVEDTAVWFRNASEGELRRYIATGEPMDKAGAYGIQGRGGLLVSRIQGDYTNVVGLPICRLGRMLAQVGEDALAQCAQKCAEKER